MSSRIIMDNMGQASPRHRPQKDYCGFWEIWQK